MAKLGLSEGFSLIPEGEHIFKIVSCEYKEKFGKIEVKLETMSGQKMTERYMVNTDGGLNAFSFLAKTALNDFSIKEIDHEDIIGRYFLGNVVHTVQPNKNDPSRTVTFANIKEKEPCDGWDDVAEDTPKTETASAPKADLSFLD